MTSLTPHFTLEELVFSSTAQRNGIDNTPGAGIIDNLRVCAWGLEQVRLLLNNSAMHIDSGYRCEALEKKLTVLDYGSWCQRHNRIANDISWKDYFATKAHPKGYAADFVAPDFGTPLDIVKVIQQSGIKFDQCIQEGSWVHISFDPALRQQTLTAQFTATGVSYSSNV